MAKRVSSAAIGMFVVGSLALIVVALAVLGSGRLFRRPHEFVCFFQGSLNGLKVGAPVKFRGVEIGTVEKIMLRLPAAYGKVNPQVPPELPVIVEVDEAQLKRQGGTGEALKPGELEDLIKRGLRAQLSMESILTGILYIDLVFQPDTPVTLVLEPGARIREVPTIPTEFAQIQKSAVSALAHLEKVDFVALARSVTDAANATRDLLGSPDLKTTLAELNQDARDLNATLDSIRNLSNGLNTSSGPLIASLKKASDQANLTLVQVSSTMATFQTSIAPDSPLAYRVDAALQDLSSASNAIRELADYLQRNPSALVRGKYVSDEKPNE